MGTLQNISDETLEVRPLRRLVEPGEEVDVDDSLLTSPGLVWPSATWLVNGGSHEHDENSPENIAKREEAERQAAEEAAAEQEAAEPDIAEETVTLSAVDSPVPLDVAAESAPTHTEES